MMVSITFRFRCDFLMAPGKVLKTVCLQAAQKDLRGKARENQRAEAYLKQYVVARR
jgi:hypothetical protein